MYRVSYLLLCEMAYMIVEAECSHGRKGMMIKWTGSLLDRQVGEVRRDKETVHIASLGPSSFLGFRVFFFSLASLDRQAIGGASCAYRSCFC